MKKSESKQGGGGRDAALRLFCLPYAGSGGSPYMSWKCKMPGSIGGVRRVAAGALGRG